MQAVLDLYHYKYCNQLALYESHHYTISCVYKQSWHSPCWTCLWSTKWIQTRSFIFKSCIYVWSRKLMSEYCSNIWNFTRRSRPLCRKRSIFVVPAVTEGLVFARFIVYLQKHLIPLPHLNSVDTIITQNSVKHRHQQVPSGKIFFVCVERLIDWLIAGFHRIGSHLTAVAVTKMFFFIWNRLWMQSLNNTTKARIFQFISVLYRK